MSAMAHDDTSPRVRAASIGSRISQRGDIKENFGFVQSQYLGGLFSTKILCVQRAMVCPAPIRVSMIAEWRMRTAKVGSTIDRRRWRRVRGRPQGCENRTGAE